MVIGKNRMDAMMIKKTTMMRRRGRVIAIVIVIGRGRERERERERGMKVVIAVKSSTPCEWGCGGEDEACAADERGQCPVRGGGGDCPHTEEELGVGW